MQFIKEKTLDNEATECDFCGRLIPEGTAFNRSTGTDGREIYTWDTCMPCLELIYRLDMYEHEDTLDYYDFITMVKEELTRRGVKDLEMELMGMLDLLHTYLRDEDEQKTR